MFAVAEDLHLEMAGALQKPFEIERSVPERRFGFRLRSAKLVLEPGHVERDAYAATAAAGAGLEDDRKADFACGRKSLVEIGNLAVAARRHWNACRFRRRARRRLVTHHADRLRGWSDKD